METHVTRLLELGGILVGLSLLARLAGAIKLPAIPLYLLAGLAFGDGGILPLVTTTEFVELGAEIGLILLLLTLGLEYSARELVATMRHHAPDGFLDLFLNATPGFVAGWLMGWGVIGASVLGGVTYVSSSGIAAKLIHDFRWSSKPGARVVVSLLVMEDLAMAIYLPVLAGVLIAGGISPTAVLGSAAALAGVAVILALATKVEVGITRFLFSHSDEALLFTIIGFAIIGAGIAEMVQISAAVGALIVGIGMSGPGIDHARRLIEPLRDFFAALFFALFGLSIDPGTLPPVLGTAALLAVVTAATKIAGGVLIARRGGYGRTAQARAGTLLVARGEFSLVIAVIATNSGLDFVGPLAAAYVLILAVVGPILVRLVDPLIGRPSGVV